MFRFFLAANRVSHQPHMRRSVSLPTRTHASGDWRHLTAAFSLVEVMLAMAIVSIGLLSLLGVMSVGLVSLRQGMDRTVESQIIRQIGARALLTPYSRLNSVFMDQTFYYDEEGTFLTNSPAIRPNATRFWATTSLVVPVYPGSTNVDVPYLSENLQTVKIDLMTGPTEQSATRSQYSIQVPNSGN